jgi:EAL domain-containing protein (putative c-di-GMP-specific phosphodiesterase class I)
MGPGADRHAKLLIHLAVEGALLDAYSHAVISLGRNLGMTTTAEGVETNDQLGILRAERCDEVQGFLFSPAVRLNETLQLLRPQSPTSIVA